MGQGGDLINLHINCPNIRDIPNNQIPLQKVGDYWGFDTRSVTVQYTETVAVLKVSSEVIKCPTIGAASFGQSPYVARLLPVRGVVGHNIDRCIIGTIQLHKYCEEHSRSEIQDNPAQINYIAGILDGSTTYTIMLRVGRLS